MMSFSRTLLERFPGLSPRDATRGQFIPAFTADELLVVVSGALAVEIPHRDTEPAIIEILGPGSGLIDSRALADLGTPVLVRALTSSSYVRLAADRLRDLLREDAVFLGVWASHLSERVHELRRRVVDLEEPRLESRVARALLYLQTKLSTPCPLASGRVLRIPQTVVGSTAGISRQSTNRLLRQFQRFGLLRLERSMVCVLDPRSLQRVGDGGEPPAGRVPCHACKLVNPSAPLACMASSSARHGEPGRV